LLWITTRRMFSETGANLALALFAFSPPLIAHFSVATVDGCATLFLFATTVAVAAWRSRPSWPVTLGAAVLGGALISNLSTPPMVLLALVIMATTRSAGAHWVARFAKAGAALMIALMIVWSAYFFHVGPVTFRNGSLSGPYARASAVIVPVAFPLNV